MKNQTTKPKIGIVSGVGPLAGADVLTKVFKNAALLYGAIEDKEYPDLILVNHGIDGVDNSGALSDTFKKEIIDMVNYLESEGANVIGIACNTAHIYLNKIKTNPKTKLINLIDSVALEASKSDDEYLLLTSNTSKKQKLYHRYLDKYGVSFIETTKEIQKNLDDAIGLVMAHKLERAGDLLDQVLSKANKNGFTSVIVGCTEIPIAIEHCKSKIDIRVIDSNQVLAQCLVTNYYTL